ncbi:hypothetical protein NKH82_17625 [Mesorhizobium sp. M0915]|uniref:hypothetical protein n=1 Tax=Mesorhizobium sp. M0915 TaxID=2957027 RepID=UPI003335BA7A
MSMDLTDWNYRTPETLEDIWRVLRRRIEVHQQWADYLRDNPNDPYAKQAIATGIGEAEKHLRYIAQYEAAIKLIAAALVATPPAPTSVDGAWWIEEREDDSFLVAPHWNFGKVCVARRPKLMTNEAWRSIAEQIIGGQAALKPQAVPATLAVPGGMEPYAHEYGKTNGDGTFSVVIERGKPKNPVPDWPVKPLFAHPLPKASIEPGAVEALRNVVTAWEATKSGKTSVREIQRWLVEDMKPAIDAARRSLALLNIANDPDQVKSRVAFAARCNEVK